jgi:hypothetical protein
MWNYWIGICVITTLSMTYPDDALYYYDYPNIESNAAPSNPINTLTVLSNNNILDNHNYVCEDLEIKHRHAEK